MAFTAEDKQKWHKEKRDLDDARWRELQPQQARQADVAICLHCHNGFGFGEGVITPEASICDVCNGD